MQLDLLPTYNVALPPAQKEPEWKLPIQPDIRSLHDVYADDLGKAEKLITFLYRCDVAAIAMDTEFTFDSAPVLLKNGSTWRDPRSQVPLILSLCVWLPKQSRLVRCAIDLRIPNITRSLEKLFRLPVPFVAHFIQAEMHTLWALGLDPVLHQTWDTWVAAKALDLGERYAAGYGLAALCKRWNVDHDFEDTKSALQQSFINHNASDDFSTDQLNYAMADAEATLKLYLAQQADVMVSGLQSHLHKVEFAYAIANARMVWDGVLIDMDRVDALRDGLDAAIGHHKAILLKAGLANPASPTQVYEFLSSKGYGADLTRSGKRTTEEKVLKQLEQREPLVSDILKFRRYSALRGDKMFEGKLIGKDGRHHPVHRHFGADTGRNSCTAPNVVGISKTFRPVVVAPEGRALLELDYAQIEICIAAAVHNDADLIAAANSEDVYSSIAQIFFADELSNEEREMSPSEFKSKRSDLRDKAKVFVLGSLYGMQEQGVAKSFGISTKEARAQLKAFFERFPSLSNSMQSSFEDGRLKGYSQIVGGLRRQVPRNSGERNKHINTPIQASAAVTFRRAIVDLYQYFKGTNTKLVLPIHDAVLIECDLGDVENVANEAAFTMKAAVRAYFPQLKVKVDVNVSDTSCWNKDGHSDSLSKFLEDPSFKL